MQQRSRPFTSLSMDDAPLPVHFGAHLRLLRDRHGLSQREIVAHLAGWQQAAYSKVEKGTRAPLFEELPRLYRALKEAGVQLTRQDREHFYLLARDLLESRKTRHARQSDEEWHALYARLATVDGLPATKDNLAVPKTPQRSHFGPIPRREIGHLLGREAWLASIIDLLARPSQMKVLILQGPPGCGKTSELHRLINHVLHQYPRTSVVLSEPAPIQLERIEPADVLEQLLGDVLDGISSAHTTLPATSLQARISYVLDSLTRADRPAVICLDNAEHLLDAQGQIEAIWQRFLTQFAQANRQVVLIIASQEWPVGTFLAESQLVRVIDVPLLSQREGSQLLQTLGVRNAPAELLSQAVMAVGGMPVCLEWLARLVREPFLRDEWMEFEEGDDDNNILLQLLSDPALFGGSVAQRVQPLLDRVLKRLSAEATTALQDLAVTPIPLGAPALKALYQSPRALRELRESSLLVAYPQRVQLLPMVAAQVRKGLTDAQVHAAEERLMQALNQWLRLGLFQQRESGNLVAELAVLQLKHEQVLETAHLLVRYGWAAFNVGHGPRLARLVWETLLPLDQENGPGSAIAHNCGSIVLLHYLAPFCEREPGRSLAADYQEVLSHIRAGAALVQPSFEVHVLHHLLLYMLNKGQFEEAEALWKSTYERLMPYLAENPDLHASLLERQAYGAGRWSDWLNEQGEQETARMQLNRALALYQKCLMLLDEREEEPLTLEASIRRKRRARVLNNLGYRLNSLGRYQEAKKIIEQSILLKEQGFTEVGALASSYGEMAQTLAGLGEYQRAFQYSDKALEEVQRLARAGHQSSQEEVWVYLVERGKLYWIVGQPEQAERLLQEARPHIHERRRIYRMTAQHILDDLEQWKRASSSSVYQLDWRWIDELRQWVSFPLYEWLDPAGPLTQEQHQQITLLMGLETEEAREQRHTIIRRSQQEEVNRALAERRNPRFSYPAILLEQVRGYIEKLRELDARISQEEPNVWVKEWYHGTIDEHLFLLYLVEATATGDDKRFWSCMRRLFPEPSQEEQQKALTSVQKILSQACLREETRETVQDTMKLFSEQFGIAFDPTLQSAEARNDSVAQPLTPPQETGSLVSAQIAKQFFERMFERHGYTSWRVVLSVHASSPYADSAARQLVLPITEQSIKQILSIYEHAVLDHVESTVAGEQSRLGLLGIGLPGYTLSREGSALYQQRQAAERAGKPFDDSTIWAGTLGILLACRVVDSSRSFFWVYLCLQHVFYLYRRLRRPDQDATIAKEKAHEIALKYCLQLYRGKPHLESKGCWTKAIVYQRGLHLVERAVAENPAVLEYLALGKMAVEHIPHLQALQVLPSKEAQHQKEQEKHDAEALLLSLVAEASQEAG